VPAQDHSVCDNSLQRRPRFSCRSLCHMLLHAPKVQAGKVPVKDTAAMCGVGPHLNPDCFGARCWQGAVLSQHCKARRP
jgi:hypothetical protein